MTDPPMEDNAKNKISIFQLYYKEKWKLNKIYNLKYFDFLPNGNLFFKYFCYPSNGMINVDVMYPVCHVGRQDVNSTWWRRKGDNTTGESDSVFVLKFSNVKTTSVKTYLMSG